jgi:hypothetical protein
LGAEVASSTFARFNEVDDEALESSIAATALDSDDGARITVRGLASVVPFTSALSLKFANTACSPTQASDGKLRCMPSADGVLSDTMFAFSDAACTTKIAKFVSYPCPQPESGYLSREIFAANGCPIGSEYVQAGATFNNAYEGTPDQCTAETPSASFKYRGIGAVVPASTFPELTPLLIGDGRLQLKLVQSGKLVVSPRGYGVTAHDKDLDIDCQVASLGKQFRCYPTSTMSVLYLDAGCTQGIANWNGSTCSDAPKYVRESLSTKTSCGNFEARYYKAGNKVAAPAMVYTRNEAGACEAYGANTGDYYALGTLVTEDSFATLSVTKADAN